ncbi:protein Dok-7 [Leucoraja erinacea]|uniref:protein Dok-7 n=1 Tax=Leucoraja erinaceus TaxID=7782 RepID=UPI002458E9F8|nr:protein Dok-7 [Leucoraja erinacea]
MTDSVVAEGQVRLRDGKKWKHRWLVLRKPSPVADCLLMLVFKDKCEKSKGHKERSSLTLEDICGLEPGLSLEGVSHILAIICLGQTVLLAFENKETMCAWDIRTRYSLGEVHRFHVTVLPGTKLESGPATLHFCNNIFVLVRDVPPGIIGHWKLSDMRRYGAIPNGFVFEGGSRCGPWAGVFFLSCAEGERISFLFDCIVRGISPTKGPFGLRPVLPDTSISTTTIEERISNEALELEKRLSLLSQSSRHSSGGDDRSLSSSTESSDTSQSDTASVGSRLTLWAEQQPAAPGPGGGSGSGPGPGPQEAGRRPGPEASGSARPHAPAKPPRCRRLQEVGRQGSSDSGIATASHSSSSGSFSSCAGSDEFGSQASLMPAARTAPTARAWCNCGSGLDYRVPAALQHHHYDSPRSILQPPGPRGEEEEEAAGACDSCGPAPAMAPAPPLIATCLSCGGLKGTTASQLGPSPTLGATDKKTGKKEEKPKVVTGQMYELMESLPTEKQSEAEKCGGYEYMASCGQQKPLLEAEGTELRQHRAATATPDHSRWCACATTVKHILAWVHPGHLSHTEGKAATRRNKSGGFSLAKCSRGVLRHFSIAWRLGRRPDQSSPRLLQDLLRLTPPTRHWTPPPLLVCLLALRLTPSTQGGRARPYKQLRGGQARSTGPSGGLDCGLQEKGFPDDETSGSFDTKKLSVGTLICPQDLAGADRPRGEGATYINIPVSPVSKKQLHYMELELQESSPAIRGASSSKYAQIDITATETAHKVGSQHAQHREERLQELEQKRKGPLLQ